MQRRKFLATAAVGTATATSGLLAAPAVAQSLPEVRWRLASSFPKSLETLFGASEVVARRVAEVTGGKFQIRLFASGEIVPGLQVLDAVQAGTVELGHTAPYYYTGKDPTFAFDSAIPFGLNVRQQSAWMLHGGGQALMREFFKDYNIISYPCGNTGTQMGGWFRKEIKTLEDLKGLKFRIAGIAGQVFAKLGAVPTQIAAGDIYPSLEKGTIDAVEFVGPYDDEKLGFYKVAKYYYYPGFWEGGTQISMIVNDKAFAALPKEYQIALEMACSDASLWVTAKYDTENADAIRRLVANGTVLRPFSRDIMQAAYKITHELYDELAAKNPKWAKVYAPWKKFRDNQLMWFRVAEHSFDSFMLSQGRQQQKGQ